MQWLNIVKKKPECNMRIGSNGVEVFVSPYSEDTAFYGLKYSTKPQFYKHGEIITGITKWAPLDGPEADNSELID